MDSKKSMMRAQEIKPIEMLITILLHWRGLIIALFVGMLLFGLGSAFKNSHNQIPNEQIDEQNDRSQASSLEEQKEILLEKLTNTQIINAENAFLCEQQYLNRLKYQEESVLMQADPFQMYASDLIFNIEEDNLEDAYNIREIYTALLQSMELRETISKEADLNNVDSFVTVQNNDSEKMEQSTVIYVRIEYPEKSMCEQIASLVIDYLNQKKMEIDNLTEKHNLILVNQSNGKYADTDLMYKQRTLESDLSSLITTFDTMVSKLDEDEKQYYDIIKTEELGSQEVVGVNIENSNSIEETSGTPSLISKRYVTLGGILCVFIYACLICVQYITNNKIKYQDDIQEIYGIPLICRIPINHEQKKMFSFVDQWISKLYHRGQHISDENTAINFASVAIQMELEINQINELTFVGESMDPNVKDICYSIEQQLKGIKVNVADGILYNAGSLKLIETAKAVIFVETAGETLYMETIQEMQIIERQDVKVLGALIVGK